MREFRYLDCDDLVGILEEQKKRYPTLCDIIKEMIHTDPKRRAEIKALI